VKQLEWSIGQDLGTTNSSACYHDGVKEKMIENAEGHRYTPSAVALTPKGGVLVGRPALSQLKMNPDFTYLRYKRVMGARYIDGEMGEHHLVPDANGNAVFKGPEDREITPEMLSAVMIEYMLDSAEARLGLGRPTGAVITIPASADQSFREATLRAAEIAGLDKDRVHLLPEPVAAAIAYGLGKRKMENVVIFDAGGGTVDCSWMRVGGRDGKFSHETLATKSAPIGGVDFDRIIQDMLVEHFAQTHGVDLALFPSAMVRIREASEKAKIELSSLPSAMVEVPAVYQDGTGLLSLHEEIDVETFNQRTAKLVDGMIKVCERTMQASGLSRSEIDCVILVGGMTNVPAIKRAVEAFFGKKPLETVNPFEVVAIGASIYAALKDGRIADLALSDRISMSIGLKNKNGAFIPVIKQGEPYPAARTVTVTTLKDSQPKISIDVRQGDNPNADLNTRLELRYVEVPDEPAGEPSVDVHFAVDENGVVNVETEYV
jgi:molecular chaperone DnaK